MRMTRQGEQIGNLEVKSEKYFSLLTLHFSLILRRHVVPRSHVQEIQGFEHIRIS